MSTWTGGNNGTPDAYSETQCSWTMCSGRVSYRFLRDGLSLCQDHALHTWSIVQEQLDAGTITQPEPRQREQSEHTFDGWVYYIRTGGRIKIGHSINISRRLAQYPPDIEILYLQQGNKKLERSEHHRFHVYLAEGREWFQDRPEVVDPILGMADKDMGWRKMHEEEYWRRRPAQHAKRT